MELQYIKYIILFLAWLLIKPLSILLSVLIIGLWSCLIEKGVWWSYLLAFCPTIIIFLGLFIQYIKDKYNDEAYNSDVFAELSTMLLILLSLIPPILISLLILMYSFVGFDFPNKYDLEDLKNNSFLDIFVDLATRS